MDVEFIVSLLNQEENEYLEFKKSKEKEIPESIVAFANASGGYIFVGVDKNKNTIVGVDIGKETIQQWHNEFIQGIEPKIPFSIKKIVITPYKHKINLKIKKPTIVVIYVLEALIKPINFKGIYWIRDNNKNRKLTTYEVTQLYYESLSLSWDAQIN